MIVLTADATMQAKLSNLDQSAEIRDSNGRLIGYFTPADQWEPLLYLQAAAQFAPEEMNQRKRSETRGVTTAEVLEHLKTLKT